MSPGLNCACVNSSSHFNHSSYCVLFYLIVLYGCVCQPLINGYDDEAVFGAGVTTSVAHWFKTSMSEDD